jgi:hypothetical protein
MKFIWKSVDSMCGYAGVFETASPAERVEVALHSLRAVGLIKWDLLRTAAEVLVYRRLLGGRVIGLQAEPVEGLAWHRVPDWRTLRVVAAGQALVTPALFRATLWHHADQGDDGMFVMLRDGRVVAAMVQRPDEEPGHRVLRLLPY